MTQSLHATDPETLIDRLRAVVGDAGLVTDSDAQAPYARDWLGKWQGRVRAVVRPADAGEVAAVVRLCHAAQVGVVTQGGNTGMSGGATPDASGTQVLLSTTRMNRIRAIDPINDTVTVDAGVVLAAVQQAAADAGRFFPLSLGAEGSCTVGGNLATNAGGIAVLRYGNMRDLVLGLEVVLPDGRLWDGLRGLRKDNTGYDLRGLFVGSEGTLGVITGAVLKLFPRPVARCTAWVGAASLGSLVDLLAALRGSVGERLTAFEMLSRPSLALVLQHVAETRAPLAADHGFHALVELADTQDAGLQGRLESALAAALDGGRIADAALAASDGQRAAFWRLREGISQAQVRAGKAVKHDIALPISALPRFTDAADAAVRAALTACDVAGQIINFGHLGDGNLHYNVLLPADTSADRVAACTLHLNRVVHDLVAQHHGSISAEHGVGVLRRDELRRYKSPLEMEMMRAVKRAFDPAALMNPGKLL